MTEQTNGNEQSGSRDFFKIIGIGRLTADPEMRYTPQNGQAVTNLRVACNIPVWDNGGMTTAPMWWRLSIWGRQAENCNQYLTKGSKILFESDRLHFDPVTGAPRIFNRQDGSPGVAFEATCFNITFLGGGQERQAEAVAEPVSQEEEVIF
jgi:single-strand DNA-binding protein